MNNWSESDHTVFKWMQYALLNGSLIITYPHWTGAVTSLEVCPRNPLVFYRLLHISLWAKVAATLQTLVWNIISDWSCLGDWKPGTLLSSSQKHWRLDEPKASWQFSSQKHLGWYFSRPISHTKNKTRNSKNSNKNFRSEPLRSFLFLRQTAAHSQGSVETKVFSVSTTNCCTFTGVRRD